MNEERTHREPGWLKDLVARRLGRTDVSIEDLIDAIDPRWRRETAMLPRRWQDRVIEGLIPAQATVLDLGCGSGELLARLIDDKQIRAQGVELDADGVAGCIERGVPVIQADVDEGLAQFADAAFDYVVLEETLQTLHRPAAVLEEMLRVGQRGIVSFPNFAHWRVRFDLALHGHMPRTRSLPYEWYDTPNIHLFALQDFLTWAEEAGVAVECGHVLREGTIAPFHDGDDNLHATEVLLVVRRG